MWYQREHVTLSYIRHAEQHVISHLGNMSRCHISHMRNNMSHVIPREHVTLSYITHDTTTCHIVPGEHVTMSHIQNGEHVTLSNVIHEYLNCGEKSRVQKSPGQSLHRCLLCH